MDKNHNWAYPQESIDGIIAACDQQAVRWQELQPGKWAINDPYQSEKVRVLLVLVGYIGRMLELYKDTREAFDDERYLSGAILSRAFVETASMTCLFLKQMITDFIPSPSDNFQQILDKHMFAVKHQLFEKQEEQIKPYHINDAIKAANELADEVKMQRKQKYDIGDNIEILVPGAEAINYKVYREKGPIGFIYSWLSEMSHPNPFNRYRYVPSMSDDSGLSDDSGFYDELLKCFISEGISTMYYASIATENLINMVKNK